MMVMMVHLREMYANYKRLVVYLQFASKRATQWVLT